MEANWLLHFTDYQRALYGKVAFLCRASPVCPLHPLSLPFSNLLCTLGGCPVCLQQWINPLALWFPMGFRSCGQSSRKIGGRKEKNFPHTLPARYCSSCFFFFLNVQDFIYLSVEGSSGPTFFYFSYLKEAATQFYFWGCSQTRGRRDKPFPRNGPRVTSVCQLTHRLTAPHSFPYF